MRVHILQHVPFESPGTLLPLSRAHGHTVDFTRLYEEDEFPCPEDFDLLIVMGGPMNVYDDRNYSFLLGEKDFIRKVITLDKMVLGICLGAQLIADVLGAEVYPGNRHEVGWFDIYPDRNTESDFLDLFNEEQLIAFHWHGDTFDLPEGARRLFSSDTTLNQGFMFGDKVLALQFHWEVTPDNIRQLIENSDMEALSGASVQSAASMMDAREKFGIIEKFMDKTLVYFEKLIS